MLTFYYHPLSPIARRVWWALLEKGIQFEAVEVDLGRGQQHEPPFATMNPFHHVPVVVDDGLRLVESLAILDYLERQYPNPALLPEAAVVYGRVRMVQMVVVNELMTKVMTVATALEDAVAFQSAERALSPVLTFLDDELQDSPFYGGEHLSLADIVAGTTVPLFQRVGVSLGPYPRLAAWQQRIAEREAWQHTNPSDKAFALWQRFVTTAAKRQARSR